MAWWLGYAIVAGALLLIVTLLCRLMRRHVNVNAYPRDRVILFQLGRGSWTPSVSPFPLKLETYLRMAKIPYMNVHGHNMSAKGKSPWMLYDGVEVADSQFCIDYINKKHNLDFNSHLSLEERATARAFQKMTEENLYWTLCAVSFGDDLNNVTRCMPYGPIVSWFVARFIRHVVWKEMWGHGIGRHAITDIINIGLEDLRALSALLGDKEFMFGDEPCETDCAYFGMLAQIRWHMTDTPMEKLMKSELTNLYKYCDRMKERFWPDWDDCITNGGTREARN